jgi:dTDP-4-dehydrorhamnose 3,5-epimerase
MKKPFLTKNKIINVEGGDVFHGMKATDTGYEGFGEAYFSAVNYGFVKAWKRHRAMTLNFVIVSGTIKVIAYHEDSSDFFEFELSTHNYARLTIPPMYWVGFKGIEDTKNILLNIANIPHDPNEVDKKNIDEVDYKW